MSQIKSDSFYYVQGKDLLAIERVMQVLFAENKISGDERRDMANRLWLILNNHLTEAE